MSELNDRELFEHAISKQPAEVPETPAEQPAPEADAGRPRDEQGRFAKVEAEAPKATPPVQAVEPQQSDETDHASKGWIPSGIHRELREERDRYRTDFERVNQESLSMRQQMAALQRQLESLQQPKPEPVNWFDDPSVAFKQNVQPLEHQIQGLGADLNLKVSRVLAVVEHGKEAVAEMEKALGDAMRAGNPEMGALSMQMRNSDNPVGVAMQWYQRDKLARETGGDLTAYRSKLSEDLLKDPAFLAKAVEAVKAQANGGQPNAKPSIVQLPPSINRQAAAGSPHEDAGDMSNGSLYAFATQR